jgi:hypothetical protein
LSGTVVRNERSCDERDDAHLALIAAGSRALSISARSDLSAST